MDSSTPYVCNNKPRPSADLTTEVQDGWKNFYVDIRGSIRSAKMKDIPFVNTLECQYDRELIDPRCAGCKMGPIARKVCDHDFQPWPIAMVQGTEFCTRCKEVRKIKTP